MTRGRPAIGFAWGGLCLALSACVAPPGPPSSCGTLSPMRIYTIYFGTSLPGGGDVTPPQWAAFVGDVVVPALPDGFTVLSGEGVWRDPVTGATIRERAQVLTVAAPLPSIAQTVDAIRKAYRVRFDQQSVGLTIHEACAEF